MRKKPITARQKKKKITKKEKKKKKKEVCTETDGMTKMTKKTPTKMMKIADTGTDTGTDTKTPSVKTTPVMNLKKKKKTKLSLNLKKSTKLNAHIHLIPADVVVKLVVDFLYDHNLCYSPSACTCTSFVQCQ